MPQAAAPCFFGLCVAVAYAFAAPGAHAQVPGSSATVTDTTARAVSFRELAITYDALLREYRMYQRPGPPPRRTASPPGRTGPDSPDPAPRGLEIGGLVVDETLTRLGRDFYELFYRLWRPPAGSANYTVVVQERPLPRLGTVAVVRVNDEIAFQARLFPRADIVETAAQQGAIIAARRLVSNASPPAQE